MYTSSKNGKEIRFVTEHPQYWNEKFIQYRDKYWAYEDGTPLEQDASPIKAPTLIETMTDLIVRVKALEDRVYKTDLPQVHEGMKPGTKRMAIIEESTGKEVELIRGYVLQDKHGNIMSKEDHWQYADGTQLDKQPTYK